MTTQAPLTMSEAIAWHLRVREDDFADWDEFTAWLERSPGNAAAYDEVALADSNLDELAVYAGRPVLMEDRASPPAGTRRRGMLGWAAAASILLVGGLAAILPQGSTYAVETAPGERRTLALADGSRIDLNGGTLVLLDRKRGRFAEVKKGEALFTVVHDDADPFTVRAGERTLVDMGTVFNVVQSDDRLEVSVAEGAVVFEPEDTHIRLKAGQRLLARGDTNNVSRIAPEAVADWSAGQLIYEDATLSEVAADLTRSAGVAVRVEPALASRRFTGVIQLEGETPVLMQRVSRLAGARIEAEGSGWLIADGATNGR